MLYRNRFYSPSLGRFVTRDPIGYRGEDENLYRYIENSSLSWIDPDGLVKWSPYPGVGPYIETTTPPPPKPEPTCFSYDFRTNQSSSWYPDHAYIRYGTLDIYGKPHKGTEGVGIGPGQKKGVNPSNNEGNNKGFRPNSSYPLCKSDCPLANGSGKGKKGSDATDEEILDCIKSHKATSNYNMWTYNCMTWAKEALRACGLKFCGGATEHQWPLAPREWTPSSPPPTSAQTTRR